VSEYRDMFGREIKVGDYVVYAAVDGRSAVQRVGRVTKLSSGSGSWRGESIPKIVCETWNYHQAVRSDWDRETREYTHVPFGQSGKQSKQVSLGFLERLVIVPAEHVHPKIIEDLNQP